jgi:hypothetical protein
MKMDECVKVLGRKLEYIKMCGDFNKGDRDYYEALLLAISIMIMVSQFE